jgi:KTSC domain
MNITAVESATLAALAYDEAHEILQLEFRSREIYRYFGVPARVYESLLAAPSKGKFFNQAIRGNFRYSRAANTWAGLQGED